MCRNECKYSNDLRYFIAFSHSHFLRFSGFNFFSLRKKRRSFYGISKCNNKRFDEICGNLVWGFASFTWQVAIKFSIFFNIAATLGFIQYVFGCVFFLFSSGVSWMRFAINNVIKASRANSQWNYWYLIAFDIVECTRCSSGFFFVAAVTASCMFEGNLGLGRRSF